MNNWTIDETPIGTFRVRRDLLNDQTVVSEHASEDRALGELSLLYAIWHTPALAHGELAAVATALRIQKRDGKFVIVNSDGAVKATFDSRDKAVAYLAASYTKPKGAK